MISWTSQRSVSLKCRSNDDWSDRKSRLTSFFETSFDELSASSCWSWRCVESESLKVESDPIESSSRWSSERRDLTWRWSVVIPFPVTWPSKTVTYKLKEIILTGGSGNFYGATPSNGSPNVQLSTILRSHLWCYKPRSTLWTPNLTGGSNKLVNLWVQWNASSVK